MALSPEDFERLRTQLQARNQPLAAAPKPETPGFIDRASQAITSRGERVTDAITGAGDFAGQSDIRRGFAAAAEASSAVPAVALEAAPKPVRDATAAFGELIGAGFKNLTSYIGDQKAVQEFVIRYPQAAKALEEVAGTLSSAGSLSGDVLGAGAAANAPAAIKNAASTASRAASSIFRRPAASIDDVINQADDALRGAIDDAPPPPPPGGGGAGAAVKPTTPAATRSAAEATAPARTIREKWVGISPDIKRRIAGKQDKLQEYFDVAHARNLDDTLPSTYEYGAQQAQRAVEQLETKLNDTGGLIGATRQKLGTYTATPDDVVKIETTFNNQLGRLNLEIDGSSVRQRPGTITKLSSGELKLLNELYSDLRVLKQNPSLTNIIDYRSALDSRINFAKSAREASSAVDPVARQVRKDLADTAARIVGPEQAAEVQRFSDFMDAYNDIKSYTDRRAGGEYLLRLVLSGRGGEARQIMQTIKEYTGIDLMDDATMMTIATDVIGNPRQQNLFRQEVTKAGLDAARIFMGDSGGAVGLLSDIMNKTLLDQEKLFLDAAR